MKKRLRVFFPQDHSTFISKEYLENDLKQSIHYVVAENGVSYIESDSGDLLVLTKSLLDRATLTLTK